MPLGPLLAMLLVLGVPDASVPSERGPMLPLRIPDEAALGRCITERERGLEALRRGDWVEAAESFRRATVAFPDSQVDWYNLACALSRTGQASPALAALQRADALAPVPTAQVDSDPDLETLRASPALAAWRQETRPGARRVVRPPEHSLARSASEIDLLAAGAERQLELLGPTLGGAQFEAAQASIARWKAASWDGLASSATDPVERERAEWEALRSLLSSDMVPLAPELAADVIARAASRGLVKSPHWTDAAYAAAMARWVLAVLASGGGLASEDVMASYRAELMAIAASSADDPALERVLTRLTNLSTADLPLAMRLHARHLAIATDKSAARRAAQREAAGVVLAVEGLPTFRALTTDGASLTNTTFLGRLTLLQFWATWCPPCIAELPRVRAVSEKYSSAKVQVIGIAVERGDTTDPGAFQEWCTRRLVTWPQVLDIGPASERLADGLGITLVPHLLLIDEHGAVIATGTTMEAIMPELERRMAGPGIDVVTHEDDKPAEAR